MATFEAVWNDLLRTEAPPPYMLIDCAGLERGEAQIPAEAFSEIECLFTGDLAEELADVGPYLGRVADLGDPQAASAKDLLTAHVSVLVQLDKQETTFAELHRHFRKFNLVYGPQNDPLFFRYYDPRVLADVLRVMEPGQLASFFGPVRSFLLADAYGNLLRCFRHGAALVVEA